jgi:hypothetical protein
MIENALAAWPDDTASAANPFSISVIRFSRMSFVGFMIRV